MEQVQPAESPIPPTHAPSERPQPSGAVRVLVALGIVIGGALVSLARQDGAAATRTIWAEDGRIFLTDAFERNLFETVLAPYNGYAHVVPRLLAALAALLPVPGAAATFAVGSAIVVGLCAWCVWWATADWIRRPVLRGVLAGVVVLVPAGQTEALNNAANLHWYLLYASAWVLVWRPPSPAARVLGLGIVFAAASSDPLVILLAPVAVVGWRRDRRAVQAPLFAVAVGLALQALSPLVGASDRAFATRPSPWMLGPWYAERVTGRLVFPARLVGDHAATRWVAAGIALTVLAVGLLALLRRMPPRKRELPAAMTLTSILAFAVPTYLTGVAAARYEVLPVLLLAGALGLVADDAVDHSHRLGLPAARAALVWLALVMALEFQVPTPRGAGPTWTRGLAVARATCATGTATARAPITPRAGAWFVVVPCHRLGGGFRR